MQDEYGDDKTREEVAMFEPQRVIRSRRLEDQDAVSAGGTVAGSGWEEYIEYIFPDSAAEQPNRKLLAIANKWVTTFRDSDSDTDSSSNEEEEGVEEDLDAGPRDYDMGIKNEEIHRPFDSSQGEDN